MMLAHNTIIHKAIDIEHEENKIIGHMYDAAFMYKDGTQFDPLQVMAEFEEMSRDLNELDIDIGIAGVIHKMRFPDLAEEISAGDWKVSMECYFKDFDIKIGEQIITRDEAKALGYSPDDLIGGFVKVMAGTKALGKHFVSRVLRYITFSGMGLVKNPANPHSIILETAEHKERLERGEQVVDMEQVDNLRGHRIELSAAKKEVSQEEKVAAPIKAITEDGDLEIADQIYVELDGETGGISRVLTVGGTESAAIRWTGPGIGGPGSVDSFPDSVCKSFKKRLTKFNALDQSEGAVVHEHWCALFEEACPVIGATAKAPECLRNVRNRTVKDEEDDALTKTVREIVENGPSNTFQTVVHRPATVNQVSASVVRSEQVSRIRTDTEELRNSLQSFVAVEKKTLK
jgi:hypothetical protein